jgi:hypothetical protein
MVFEALPRFILEYSFSIWVCKRELYHRPLWLSTGWHTIIHKMKFSKKIRAKRPHSGSLGHKGLKSSTFLPFTVFCGPRLEEAKEPLPTLVKNIMWSPWAQYANFKQSYWLKFGDFGHALKWAIHVKSRLVTTLSAKRRIWFTSTNKEMRSRRCYDAHEHWNGELRRQASGSQLKTWSPFEWPLQSLHTSAFLSAKGTILPQLRGAGPCKRIRVILWFFLWSSIRAPTPPSYPANVDMNKVMVGDTNVDISEFLMRHIFFLAMDGSSYICFTSIILITQCHAICHVLIQVDGHVLILTHFRPNFRTFKFTSSKLILGFFCIGVLLQNVATGYY